MRLLSRFRKNVSLLALTCLGICLTACDSGPDTAGPPPPSKEALDAIASDPGAAREQLGRAIDRLFNDEAVGQTHALLVMHRGKIAAERYADGYGKDSRLLGWSLSNCVTGIMTGLLVSDGRLRLNESVPVTTWQRSGDPRGEITLKQLLQMRSGLRHNETKVPTHESDLVRMLFLDGRDDMAAYAEAQPLGAEPGAKFEYSSATAIILADVSARSLSNSDNPDVRRKLVADYLRTRLFEPARMGSMTAEFDAAGTMIGSSMIHATARDWGKLGEFLRHGGSVRGAQLIPRRWIEFMRSPSPRHPGYGAQLWLNRPHPHGEQELFPAMAPDSLTACIGDLGQYIIASPQQKLTVVRLGHSDRERRPDLRDRLGELVALYPAN
ncbi:MAG: serine hydrolase [Novosphingobium sp.]|nr:serine hydrolase [Novosphingobium sp.]